jgi:hypothetical protein
VIWAARVICGIRYEMAAPRTCRTRRCLLSKHQSAWETIFYVADAASAGVRVQEGAAYILLRLGHGAGA